MSFPHGPARATSSKGRGYSARPFYTTILAVAAISIFSITARQSAQYLGQSASHAGLQRRAPEIFEPLRGRQLSGLVIRDRDCHLVHHAKDKCAYVRANCPDEEAGLLSYLSLYYCRLPHAQPVAFAILVLWLALLFTTIGIAASDFFCINLSTISSILGMSESIAGVTFLAFGNGSPDVFSTFAAMSTHSGSLAVGELIGAASFITAVVAGSMALVRPFKVAKRSFVRDVGFFIFSASFSILFLADGRLQLWECALMVGFYVCYVVTVVVWHWWLRRRRKRREREALSRSYYVTPGNEEVEVSEEGEEDEDADASVGEWRSLLMHGSAEDFGALELGGLTPRLTARDEEEEEEDREDAQERLLAGINSSMRVSGRPRHERRNTLNPIRPSLVGALEFRAVLSSLQKSRASQTLPIPLRRYSDDPNYTAGQQKHRSPSVSGVAVDSGSSSYIPEASLLDGSVDDSGRGGGRTRAVSTNDAIGLSLDPSSFRRTVPDIDILASSPPGTDRLQPSEFGQTAASSANLTTATRRSPSPSISISPPPSQQVSRRSSQSQSAVSPNLLAPPQEGHGGNQRLPLSLPASADGSYSPKLRPPQLVIPRYSDEPEDSASEFPTLYDSPLPISTHGGSGPPSIRLPPSSLSPTSSFYNREGESQSKPLRWWPYSIFPSPEVLGATIFPTLCGFKEKNIYEKFLGLVVAPSVFLLTVTLPVVENDKDDDTEELVPTDGRRGARSRIGTGITIPLGFEHTSETASVPGQRSAMPSAHRSHGLESSAVEGFSRGNMAGVAHSPKTTDRYFQPKPSQASVPDRDTSSLAAPTRTSNEWNRWLVAVQILTGPLFVVLIVWANTTHDPADLRTLLLPVLYALLASLIALALLFLTTTADRTPRWHFLLCFVGFAVSIAWISTIANEVVGVLKAFGVILGISDAILGLTVFAVGNSLGDLVADVTIARLGLPVMALSACFGGPMLNILLGIGISGLYIMIRDGKDRHEKHPNKDIRYKPYEIEVSSTLMISAATLLVTLVGLLIVVPWNKWMMDRRIGWGLIALWTVSTLGNLMVEIAGWGGNVR